MECDTYQEQMSLRLDGQLTPDEMGQLDAHVATCAVCRTSLDALRRVDRLLVSVPAVSPAPGFTSRFEARLAARRHRRRAWAGLLTLMVGTLFLLVAAMTLVTISGLVLWESLSADGLLIPVVALVLDLGKALAAALKLIWLVLSAMARGTRHPAFVAFSLAGAILTVIWAQLAAHRALVPNRVAVELEG